MAVSWTAEQQQVIQLRNRNILVSAAAGSGKTAVLVERIIAMISDQEHPVDVDHLLIVTFTNAAAGEMRERIRMAIEQKIEENSDNEHLEKQLTLVHHAQITTIHSFCQYVIRNYFHLIDLDPSFRIGDEGEIKLLKNEIIDELLEEAYREKDPRFLNFIECYAPGKSDREIGNLILQLHEFSMSYPWPLSWLESCAEAYQVNSVAELGDTAWVAGLTEQVRLLLADCLARVRAAIAVTGQPDGPYMYREALAADEQMIQALCQADGYLQLAEGFQQMGKFAVLSRKRDDNVSDDSRELVKGIRDGVKKALKAIQEQYFYDTPEAIVAALTRTAAQAGALTRLAAEFSQRFTVKKREKNLLDFNDLEHLALQILISEEHGQAQPTEAARQLAEQFEEVMIDEYQDSNLVQEYILTSVSKISQGRNNVFMVGDVKQSIYRFRLARPELFMEKYDHYQSTDSPRQKIELHKNFRSRSQVLDSVNYIFRKIMIKELGNVKYDDNAALYTGAVFPEKADQSGNISELLLLDLDTEAEMAAETGASAVELEARMIGSRIQQLVGNEMVLDKQSGEYRPAEYRDIVILLRTMAGWADPFTSILSDMGIPAFAGSQTGYFAALEVQTILSLLKVIDNPRQDIPLAAVLRSPIGGLTDEQLAAIRSSYPEGGFAEACRRYQGLERLEHFWQMIADFRQKVPYTTMHELIWYILERTGYGDYARAMPGGEQREANLNMLVEKAMAYESTSYRGLFNFVRYIEQLRKYDVDYGEANILGEEGNVVRIMSIHKSKGLEFPIVFAAGLNKKFNQQDSRSKLVLHPELKLGCDCIDPQLRVKSPTLLKRFIQRQTAYENLGEELRVLYVAMTRAKEKLIMTGAVAGLEDKQKKWRYAAAGAEAALSFGTLSQAASYLDWLMPALLGSEPAGQLFQIETRDVSDLVLAETVHIAAEHYTKEQLLNWNPRQNFDEQARTRIETAFAYRYKGEDNAGIYGKISVSELKSLSQTDDPEGYRLYPEEPVVPLIPAFIKERETTGAALGTIYHKVMEHLDYQAEPSPEGIAAQIAALGQQGKLKPEEAAQVRADKILGFCRSPLGRRMARAAAAGTLYREQQFVLGVPACEIREQWQTQDIVLVQGMIDAYFVEDDEIVVVDYKTDYVPGQDGRVLLDKYASQLKYYSRALAQMTGRKVKEQVIYSFWLQKELRNR